MAELNGIIREDKVITDNILYLGSELVFDGGSIIYNGTSSEELIICGAGLNSDITYGDGGTNIVAGDRQIFFGENITFKGKWNIKGTVYASWFGMVESNGGSYDSSVAINTAIKLKCQGEVRLPKGSYEIFSHISMPEGIQLIGAGPDIDGNIYGTVIRPYVNPENYISSYRKALASVPNGKISLPSIPFPLPTVGYCNNSKDLKDIECGYMIVVNIQDEVGFEYDGTDITYFHNHAAKDNRHRNTLISNIDLAYNGSDGMKHQYRGILFEGGIEIYNVRTYGLVQFCGNAGIYYSDNRYIHDCNFVLNDSADYSLVYGKIYAFDLNGLGDALRFCGNHVCTYNSSICSLRLESCFGGIVEGNILNSDVIINKCKAITFNGNHCEYGIKMDVRGSSVSICDNIFWKGAQANIRIRRIQYPLTDYQQSVVLRNNTFVYFMKIISLKNSHNVSDVSPYEVVTDGWANIVIENCFRTRHYDDVTEFEPTGIKVGLLTMYEDSSGYYWDGNEYSSLDDFNKYSHINSLQSVISGTGVSSGVNKALNMGSPLSGVEVSFSELYANRTIYKNYYSGTNTGIQYTIYEMYDINRR